MYCIWLKLYSLGIIESIQSIYLLSIYKTKYVYACQPYTHIKLVATFVKYIEKFNNRSKRLEKRTSTRKMSLKRQQSLGATKRNELKAHRKNWSNCGFYTSSVHVCRLHCDSSTFSVIEALSKQNCSKKRLKFERLLWCSDQLQWR